MANGRGFFDSFEAGGIFAPLVFSVVGSFGTSGDDERVIGEDGAIEKCDGFRGGIEIMGFAEKDFGIFWRRRTERRGAAISPGESAPVAT